MSDALMWFGTKDFATWVPAPDSGADRARAGASWSYEPDNGGLVSKRSKGNHSVFDWQWTTLRADGPNGLWKFQEFASGYHGDGFLYFVDPMTAAHNVMPENWAAPFLIEQGHHSFIEKMDHNTGRLAPLEFTPTPLNSFGLPRRSLIVPGQSTTRETLTLFIPPGHKLLISIYGFRLPGDTDNSPAYSPFYATAFNYGREYRGTYNLVLSPPNETRREFQNIYVNRSAGGYVEVTPNYTETAYALTGIMAKIVPEDTFPTITQFQSGLGQTGCEFLDGDATPETYIIGNGERYLSSLSSTLGETEQWTRTN